MQEFSLGVDEKKGLLVLARSSVEGQVREGKLPDPPSELVQRHPHLGQSRACFVTLRKRGELRGCIGSLEPRRSLIDDVRHNAAAAATHDTRFAPVTAQELASLEYSISVLDMPQPLAGVSVDDLPAYLAKHRPGVVIELHGRRSTFLPSVWEDLSDPYEFLARLCRKQGAPALGWRDPAARISIYGSIHFEESE